MRYKYIKIIQSKLCDETIDDDEIKRELINKIIGSKLNCSISINHNGWSKTHKTVKLIAMSDDVISIIIQERSGSFKTTVKLQDLTAIEIKSFSDIVSVDNEKNRYEFLECWSDNSLVII